MTEQSNVQDPRLDPSHPPPWQPLGAFRDIWPLTKQIDELGGEWSFPIFIPRTANFHLIREPISFYEPIESFDRLGLEALLIQKAYAFDLGSAIGSAGVSLTVFPSIFDAVDGVLPLPEQDEPPIGQHYMGVVGVKDRDTLVIRNSWLGWTSDGLGYMSREYFEHHAAEGLVLRRWDYGPSEDTAEPLLSTTDQDEFKRQWRRRRKFGSSSSGAPNPRVKRKWYGCWSLEAEAPAEVLLVEFDKRIRVGVAVITHYQSDEGPSISALSDLFIWPNYRRVGYGLLLECFAAERSVVAGSSRMAIHVWNADTVKGKDRAIGFLRAAGYSEIEESSETQYVLYAERSIR